MSKNFRNWWRDHADPDTFLREQLPRTEAVRPIIYEMLRTLLKPGDWILDVACGPAIDYEPIRDMGFNWIGVDVTEKFVDYVIEKYGWGKVDIYEMDVSKGIDFANGNFEVSYAKDLFEHLGEGEWRTVVSEMWKVCSRYMILAFFKPPDENPTEYHVVTSEENPETAGVHSNHYSRKELLDYIRGLPRVHSVSIKENVVYRRRWIRPKGYSIWLVRRMDKKGEKDADEEA
jgi:ubiquinone/menaquinone biosynthesis C-methylase UbiE